MRLLLTFLLALSLFACESDRDDQVSIAGLQEPVEIIRDEWGINHIYAENQHDLFFAQGYAAAKDRLFQFEIWRRQATGTVAEILGESELKRDIGTRLFKFRGDMTQEMNHYHEDGEEIINAYTQGVNAYIDEILSTPDQLPIEFKLLNIVPEKWTADVVISRHQGLLGNIGLELKTARAVAKLGEKKVKELNWFHPKDPDLVMDPSIDQALLADDILGLYNAYRKRVEFSRNDILPAYRNSINEKTLALGSTENDDAFSIGSNNWVVSGDLTADGNTYMANDPHRTIAVPSLRYMVHLVAPEWDVIGGGEPEIPGISIGHNAYGSWGLTVFRTDGEDLYVYDLNPTNRNQYLYNGSWEDMRMISETIKVKDQEDVDVELQYTRHGPVTYVDSVHNKAYAVRCAWLETGGSPYLASLRMDQAKTWEEFQAACNYSHIPGENMVWADKEGNIGWQSVGIAPIRTNFSGLVPVPGDGRYEWEGYLPIIEKPHTLNPPEGYFATANQNVTPADYEHWNAIGFSWADPFRGDRVEEVLSAGNQLNMDDMKALQVDYHSNPASKLVPMILELPFTGQSAAAADKLRDWDYELGPKSIEAAIYVAFENEISSLAKSRFIPPSAVGMISSIQMSRIMEWINEPDNRFGPNPIQGRDQFLSDAFNQGVMFLNENLGEDMDTWQYGQQKLKHTYMAHALSEIVNEEIKAKIDIGPLPRGGNSYTPGSSGGNMRQSSGASFRMIVNTGDWDAAVATNGPGQSGNPQSPFYKNLFEPWANDQYFPVYYSRSKIESAAANRTLLKPTK
ncbi:MAG: penicillin amidase [Cyclobacteriaceae bacterium]|jgi:penicillin amidase